MGEVERMGKSSVKRGYSDVGKMDNKSLSTRGKRGILCKVKLVS